MPQKINFRFVIFTACVFLVPFFTLAYHFNRSNTELARYDMRNALSVQARITARQARTALQPQHSIAALLDSKAFAAAGQKNRREALEKMAGSRNGVFLQFSYLDASGMEKFRVKGSTAPLANHSGSELFRIAARGGSPGIVRTSPSASPVLTIAEPVFDGDKIQAVLVSVLSLETLSAQMLSARQPGDRGETGIADDSGMIIANSRNGGKSAPVSLPKEVFAMRNAPEGANAGGDITMPDGSKYLIAFAPVPETQWWAYEMEPESSLKKFWPSSCGTTPVFGGSLLIIVLAFLVERLAHVWLRPDTGDKP